MTTNDTEQETVAKALGKHSRFQHGACDCGEEFSSIEAFREHQARAALDAHRASQAHVVSEGAPVCPTCGPLLPGTSPFGCANPARITPTPEPTASSAKGATNGDS